MFVFVIGMDCKPSNDANKKLIQARLPFKRLNPEPKENQPPKRPCAHACPEPEVSDRENENEPSPLSVRSRPPLVNGRGPLDGFLSRRCPAASSDENHVIDLTEDIESPSVKQRVSPASASPCVPAKDKHQCKDKSASSKKSSNVDDTPKTHTLDCIVTDDAESLQEQEERLRLRQEKERQKEQAKAAKEKKKEEARKLKEEREREKREKKEKDEREKREKKEKEEKEKAERLKAKEELRKAKQDINNITTLAAACGKFAPFEIKENMYLAPLCRVQCEDSVLEELDRCLLNPADNLNGLKDWIGQKPRWSGPTKPRECTTVEGPKPDGVPDRKRYGPMKLLKFHENYRPAYWGTWSKKSSHISPRCPLRQDKDLLDYEVDSDEEWEEEEPGESLSHSEGVRFFTVCITVNTHSTFQEGGDLEKQKLRQKLKAREWDELMSTKKKMKVLEPVVRGCVWEGEGLTSELFQPYAVCLVEPLPKADTSPSPEESKREEKLLGQLLPLLHGNLNSWKVIITEFQEFYRQQTSSSSSSPPDPMQLRRLMKNNAVYEKRSTYRRCCWYVHPEVLSRFGQEALPVPCQWTYLTTGAREDTREEPQAATGSQGNSPTTPQTSSTTSSSSNKRKSTGSMSITKFMKKCTESEQTEATEADGFQADTEDDDEEDCVIISTQSGESPRRNLKKTTPSDTAALPEASSAPTLATV
uniref:Chromatin assembly factor 1 subunit A n=1 Tax=Stegastes partitus TaxID=144197 RepID=A0A3B5ADW5_9TELE